MEDSQKYYVAQCDCKMKLIRAKEPEMLYGIIENDQHRCPNCKSMYHDKGFQNVIIDTIAGETRKFFKPTKEVEHRDKKAPLDRGRLYDLDIIDYTGMPRRNMKTGEYSAGKIAAAFGLALQENDIDRVKRIYNENYYYIEWNKISKTKRKRIQQILNLPDDKVGL